MNVAYQNRIVVLAAFIAGIVAVTLLFRTGRPEISGRVTLKGTPPAEIQIVLDPTSAKLRPNGLTTRHYLVSPKGGLANVFVWIKSGLTNYNSGAATEPVVMEFRGARLEPYVIGVLTNQPVRFASSDPMLQNVHCTPRSPGNREFNFAFAPRTATIGEPWYKAIYRRLALWRRPISAGTRPVFGVAEPFVRVKCDVHPWEFGYICVADHPFFAVSDEDGAFRFPAGLPPGRYVIEARHLKAGAVTQEIVIGRGEHIRLDFMLEVPTSSSPSEPSPRL